MANELVPRARRGRRSLSVLALSGLVAALTGVTPVAAGGATTPPAYDNPLKVKAGAATVQSCADPTVMRGAREADSPTPNSGPSGDRYWYMYCTKDPLNDSDRDSEGRYRFRNIPMFRSADLVHWEYQGNVFKPAGASGTNYPAWVDPNAGLFAPEIQYFNGKYRLYYSVTDTSGEAPNESAIGVATSNGPLGPWVDSGDPVVDPEVHGCCGDAKRATIDPEILTVGATRYIFFGSYFGGLFARTLSADGTESVRESEVRVAIDNRYEGPEITKRGEFYYMFVSATDCCRGPATGYSVFVGRSKNPLGPYVDSQGRSFLDNHPGGDVALSMNGNRWVGPGHNTVFYDTGGQMWTIYHAINRFKPYYAPTADFPRLTQRPALMDPVDWVGKTATDPGWPNVRSGRWASNVGEMIPGPAAQPGQKSAYRPKDHWDSGPGTKIENRSDEFNGSLGPQWSWIRQPPSSEYGVENGHFRFNTQDQELFEDCCENASLLVQDAPAGDYVVDAKLKLNLPDDACCRFIQAGLIIRAAGEETGDDNFLKLVKVGIFNTRQVEYGKEIGVDRIREGYPRVGNTVVGPPGKQDEYTYLRIIHTEQNGIEFYKAFSSLDGQHWYRGGTWTHSLGAGSQIGLLSFGGTGFVANFDYVRVYNLNVVPPSY